MKSRRLDHRSEAIQTRFVCRVSEHPEFGNTLGSTLGKNHVGLLPDWYCTFPSVNISIRQEGQFFELMGISVILGKVPEGLILTRFRGNHTSAKKYGRMFAKNCSNLPGYLLLLAIKP